MRQHYLSFLDFTHERDKSSTAVPIARPSRPTLWRHRPLAPDTRPLKHGFSLSKFHVFYIEQGVRFTMKNSFDRELPPS